MRLKGEQNKNQRQTLIVQELEIVVMTGHQILVDFTCTEQFESGQKYT